MALGEEEQAQLFRKAREALESGSRIHVVSHVDLDGLSSAAIIMRWARSKGKEVAHSVAGVRGLYTMAKRALQGAAGKPGTVVVIADLSPRGRGDAEAIATLAKYAKSVIWLDHHVWEEDVETVLEKHGVIVIRDRSKVTAELACFLTECWNDEVSKKLVEIARADDSCSEDPYGLADKWRLVLRYLDWEGLRRAAQSLSRGELWPDWAREIYEKEAPSYYREIREKTSVLIESFNGIRVAVVTPPPRASACDVQRLGATPGPDKADVVVIVYPKGLSIKTWGRLRADCIAAKLGGGGHSNVAGAPRPSTTMGSAQIARMVANAAKECLSQSLGPVPSGTAYTQSRRKE
ncbi:DHHA1 domain-containing protein [Pyrofollis japonicus]|uniref:DHH family phosphoesterase n=1 Tax=Pyrofollis japonicus TaxID=3060460 RepID=UPI00295BE59E|nr:DHH family phosphoesterase [Pyrofollis japonicus]BEP16910.1 DHHA1 domain-containing protein [Pyrofollis japonicus]